MTIIIFILISAGIFSILSSVLKLPPYSATQRLRGVAGKTKMTETLNQRLQGKANENKAGACRDYLYA